MAKRKPKKEKVTPLPFFDTRKLDPKTEAITGEIIESNKGKKGKSKLKYGEARFIAERIRGKGARAAAVDAGLDYVPRGKAVEEAKNEMLVKAMTAEDATVANIVREINRIAFSDPRKLFYADGTARDIVDLDDDTAAIISGFDVEKRTEGHGEDRETFYILKPRLWNKMEALKLLAQYRAILSGAGDERAVDRLDEVVAAIQEPLTK